MSVKESVVKIENEIFTPALQEAMKKAEDRGINVGDSIMSVTNAHLNMLVELVGIEKTITMLQNQVAFLQKNSKV